MLISTTICHRGLVRDQNEDSCISNEQSQLWLIADGVGGNQGGKVASEMAVQTIDRRYRQGLPLTEAILEANRIIVEAGQQQDLNGMATTVVAAGFSDSRYQLAWIGDSRAYLITQDSIRQLSADHNVATALYQQGEIPEHEVFDHPGQHELTRALGLLQVNEVPCLTGTLKGDQCMLLCTDGLSGVLRDQQILRSYCRHMPRSQKQLKQLADDLLQQVLTAGAPDNVCFTLIIPDSASRIETTETVSAEAESGLSAQGKTRSTRRPVNKAPITWLILSIVILIMLFLFLD